MLGNSLARTSSSSSGGPSGVVASLESLTKDQLVVALKRANVQASCSMHQPSISLSTDLPFHAACSDLVGHPLSL